MANWVRHSRCILQPLRLQVQRRSAGHCRCSTRSFILQIAALLLLLQPNASYTEVRGLRHVMPAYEGGIYQVS